MQAAVMNSDSLSDILENDTDLQNARWFIFDHGQDTKYCADFGKWLLWDGKRWKIAASEEVLHLAASTAESMLNEARTERNKELLQRALRLQNLRRMKSMLELAASDPAILITADRLDTNPYLLNTQNGTLDLKTGELREHRRENFLTKLTAASFDPEAECPLWLRFLDRIMGGDTEMIDFLQKAVGYSLTGSTDEQAMFILHGGGQNGKSTFINTISGLLADFSRNTPMETLLSRRNDGIRNDIARLRGARFVTAIEAESGRRFSEPLVKSLTGGDTITARFLHAEHFDFQPQMKLWIGTNHKPHVKDNSDGFWRRVRLVPFTAKIPDQERDLQFGEKLKLEYDGILAWAVEGCRKWREEGLRPPNQVVEATSAYRKQSDVLAGFIDDICILNEQVRVNASDLFEAFKSWCQQTGEELMTQTRFGEAMSEKGFTKVKSGGKKWYLEIGLLQG